MTTFYRQKRMFLRPLAAALLLAGPLHAALAQPDTASVERRAWRIEAGALAPALNRFAQQAGLVLSFDPQLVADKKTAGLNGEFATADALETLLTGTALEAVRLDNGGYTLRAAPPNEAVLRAVKVRAAGIDGVTEGSRSYTTPAVTVGGKTPRDLRQIQQSVSVVTSQRIHDQALTTTEEALGQATGVTLARSGGYSSNADFSARGFPMGIQIDGGAAGLNSLWYHTGLPDLAGVDHIEVLRGSDGVFGGMGEPGGIVNVVRKRALGEQQVLVDVMAGSWDRLRTQIDVTGPLGLDGRLRGRLVAADERRDYFYKPADSNKSVLYGVLEADLTDSTLLSVGINYEQQELNGLHRGLPRYSTGADLKLSRSDCLCADWSGRDDDTREVFIKLEQQIGDDWRARINVSKQWLDYEYEDGYVGGAPDPVTGAGSVLSTSRTDVSNELKLADLTIDGRFRVWGIGQELIAGFNWQDMYSHGTGVRLLATAPAVNPFTFDPDALARPAVPASYVPRLPFGGQKQTGTYLTLRSLWTDAFHSVVGVRISSYEYIYSRGGDFWKESDVRTPYFGLNYDLTDHLTIYASYAQIYQSQAGNLDESLDPLEPAEGNTSEIGVKGSWLDNTLTASLAAYQVRRENGAMQVSMSAEAMNCCYVAIAEIESRGIDAEITGELLPGWQLSMGYTFNLNEYKSGYGEQDGTRYTPTTPKHLLKLWTMAQLPGAWSALRVGGGVNWQSDNFVTGTAATYDSATNQYNGPSIPFKYTQKAYAVASLRAEYQVNPQWSVALNVNNLFDESYYQTVSSSTTGNYYGEPRNWLLSAQGKF